MVKRDSFNTKEIRVNRWNVGQVMGIFMISH